MDALNLGKKPYDLMARTNKMRSIATFVSAGLGN
jgi:hypothetical protein